MADANIIGAFPLGTTSFQSLVHKLGHKHPRITKESLDVVTSHASDVEADRAIFNLTSEGKGRWDTEAGKGLSDCPCNKEEKRTISPSAGGHSLFRLTGRMEGFPQGTHLTTSTRDFRSHARTTCSLSKLLHGLFPREAFLFRWPQEEARANNVYL